MLVNNPRPCFIKEPPQQAWGDTYRQPTAKIPSTAILFDLGILNPKKIQNGNAKINTSVKMVILDWMIWKLSSIQTVSGSCLKYGFQLVSIGIHWNSAPNSTAIACP